MSNTAVPAESADSTICKDLISYLPEEILHHIVSFVTTREAIRTSILSKRWRSIWSYTPNLSFNTDEVNHTSVDKTLALYASAKIKSFVLHYLCMDDDQDSRLCRWIQFATDRHVEELSLHFGKFDRRPMDYEIPQLLFYNPSLIKLNVKLGLQKVVLRGAVSWNSLKSLSFRRCDLIDDESFARILSGCPLLECLKLKRCLGIRHLNLKSSKFLRTLKVVFYDRHTNSMKIVAPQIQSLTLKGSMFSETCSLVDVSSLIKAKTIVTFTTHHTINVFDVLMVIFMNLLEKLLKVEKLCVGTWCLQMLSVAELKGIALPTLKCKTLELETKVDKWTLLGMARLIQNSVDLKQLSIKVRSLGSPWSWTYLGADLHHELNEDKLWRSKESIFPCLGSSTNTEETKFRESTEVGDLKMLTEFIRTTDWIPGKVVIDLRQFSRETSEVTEAFLNQTLENDLRDLSFVTLHKL